METSSRASLHAAVLRWPLREPFVISRHVFTENLALEVSLRVDGVSGHGESEPHEHDLRVVEAARDAAAALSPEVWCHLDPDRLNTVLPRSALRTAVDCALWDLLAKRAAAWRSAPTRVASTAVRCLRLRGATR
jgi:L-alanine-DL-glutamate epimerase-like enolase superfamily enzyme